MTRKRLALIIAGLAVLPGVVVFGISWYYSVQIEDGVLRVKHDPPTYEVKVVELEENQVKLRFPTEEELRNEPEKMGIEWDVGYAGVGETLDVDGAEALREYTLLDGELVVGEEVRFDKFAYPGDPAMAHSITFQEIKFASPLGELTAWQVDGSGETWVIFVHGKGASRREALRMLPVVEGKELPSLVITYRNDTGAPEDPSGYYWYGLTEWEDLEAAARYALDNGATGLVIVGYSMGGGIVANFLYRSPLAGQVVGVILDSPMLDLDATVDMAAENRNLPAFLTTITKVITSFRFGVDWDAMDYLDRASEISAPVLLFHGDADEKVPVSISERFAESRPDLVTYEVFAGAPHGGAWNVDSKRYEAVVGEFVDRVAR